MRILGRPEEGDDASRPCGHVGQCVSVEVGPEPVFHLQTHEETSPNLPTKGLIQNTHHVAKHDGTMMMDTWPQRTRGRTTLDTMA
jgi:hypothetical protein